MMEELRADRTTEALRCSQSPSTIYHPASAGASRGHSCNHIKHDHPAQHPASPVLVDLSEAVRDTVAQSMRQIPVLKVSSTDECSSLEEELITIPTKKKSLKSGRLRTADLFLLQ